MRFAVLIFGALLAMSWACGSTPQAHPVATINGTFGGHTFEAQDAISSLQADGAVVVITDLPSLCSFIQHNPGSAKSLVQELGFIFLMPISVGTFDLGRSGRTVLLGYQRTDSACADVQAETAVSGTVTITSVSVTGVVGSFDAMFGSGTSAFDHVTGVFTASACNVPQTDGGTCL